jgi:dynein heavy chain
MTNWREDVKKALM